eukprot:1929819-Karenia_brevis.AAC.1
MVVTSAASPLATPGVHVMNANQPTVTGSASGHSTSRGYFLRADSSAAAVTQPHFFPCCNA